MPEGRSILLVDGQPYQHREKVLVAGNYSVTSVKSLAEAGRKWAPYLYQLVLIVTDALDGDPLEFCESLKERSPRQLLALLTGHNIYVPGDACPDEVISKDEGPKHLLSRVRALLEPEPEPEATFAD